MIADPEAGADAGSRTSTSTARRARACAGRWRDGLRYVLGNRYLRAIAACTGSANLFSNIAFATYLVYVVRVLGLDAATIGVVLGLGQHRRDPGCGARGADGSLARRRARRSSARRS